MVLVVVVVVAVVVVLVIVVGEAVVVLVAVERVWLEVVFTTRDQYQNLHGGGELIHDSVNRIFVLQL